MALFDSASDARFLFEITGFELDLSLVNFTVSEAISAPFSVRISIASGIDIPDIASLVGKEGLLTIINDTSGGITFDLDVDIDTSRYFHGMIRKFEYTGMSGSSYLYEAHLVPTLWSLTLRTNCRIFQDKNVQDIFKEVLDKAGITGDRVRFALTNKNRMRGFCVQYRETDFNFISRLMEEEGIFYFFEHYEDKHVVVFGDSPVVHVPIKGEPEICFRQGAGMVSDQESVHSFTFSHRLKPGAYTARNFSFKNPALDLTVEKKGEANQNYEVYDYSGNYVDPKRGADFAKIRQEEFAAQAQRGQGASSSPRIIPGYTFTLGDHDYSDLNQEYLLVSIEHYGTQPQSLEENSGGTASYHNQFTVIPYSVTFRPPQATPKPFVTGVQTAIVVGPKGEEIHVDGLGRIKVQFHWDRQGQGDDKSSCWIRAAQAWAGGGWGAVFTPRVGDEVLVDFIEGDPDRPIIVGSVYNATNPTLYNPAELKTVSGFRTKSYKAAGYNELRFEDKAGSEQIYVHGQKDFKIDVGNNEIKKVANTLENSIGKTATINAGEQLRFICGNASIVLDQSGKIVIHGTEVFVTGSGALHLDGKPIQLNMGGAAGVAAAISSAAEPAPAYSQKQGGEAGQAESSPAPADQSEGNSVSPASDSPDNALPDEAAPVLSPAKTPVGPHAQTLMPAQKEKWQPLSGLGEDVDKLVAKSSTLKSKLQKFTENDGAIVYGPVNGGSAYYPTKNRIVIDGAFKGDASATAALVSHELGHATSPVVEDWSSKAAYVKSKLAGEGEATLSNLECRSEILKNGGQDIGVLGSKAEEYKKIYKDYLTDGKRGIARDAIGKIFDSGEIASTSKKPYSNTYGDYYESSQSVLGRLFKK